MIPYGTSHRLLGTTTQCHHRQLKAWHQGGHGTTVVGHDIHGDLDGQFNGSSFGLSWTKDGVGFIRWLRSESRPSGFFMALSVVLVSSISVSYLYQCNSTDRYWMNYYLNTVSYHLSAANHDQNLQATHSSCLVILFRFPSVPNTAPAGTTWCLASHLTTTRSQPLVMRGNEGGNCSTSEISSKTPPQTAIKNSTTAAATTPMKHPSPSDINLDSCHYMVDLLWVFPHYCPLLWIQLAAALSSLWA